MDSQTDPKPKRLNIGCGKRPIEGYDNLDIKNIPGIKYPKIDARKLPIKDNTYDEVFAHWVLEHFSREEIISVLKEWRRVLKPGGLLRIVTNNQSDINLALQLAQISWEEWNLLTFGAETKTYEGCHKIGLDWMRLISFLKKAGFIEANVEIEAYSEVREKDGSLKCPALKVGAIK